MFALVTFLLLATGADACMRSRAFVRLGCPRNVHRTAERRATSALVSWSRLNFTLESSHSIKGIYQTVPIYGASSTVNRHFPEGIHYVEYKAVDESGNFDSCSFSVSVSVIRCSAQYNPRFGIVTCDANNVYGSTCAVVCIPGYAIVGSGQLQCRLDGRWTDDMPFCRPMTCPEPGTPLGGDRLCTTLTHTYGSICKFDCNDEYQLVGHDRIICKSNGNQTYWSGRTPICEELIPPTVEQCPGVIERTTSEMLTEIQRPTVVFRTAHGIIPDVTCTHFGSSSKHSFPLGTHHVKCTAFDPDFGERASATCEFTMKIKANPCRALQRPLNGFMLCHGAHGGGSSFYNTTCRLFCNKGYAHARDSYTSGVYGCDNTGTWRPSERVSSCVKPRRPRELRLPSEIFFRSSNCSSARLLEEMRVKFQSTLHGLIRMRENCAMADCIVEDVVPTCRNYYDDDEDARRNLRGRRRASGYNRPRTRRGERHDVRRKRKRRKRHRSARADRRRSGQGRRRGRRRRKRHGRRRDKRNGADTLRGRTFLLAVEFNFATRISESGKWPDEYHRALHRLLGMFDHFEELVTSNTFRLHERVSSLNFSVVNDSLTHMNARAVCDIQYKFNTETQLCVSCGAGTYYDITGGRCVICGTGEYQNEAAQYECKRCPLGTTTAVVGAINRTQCVDIDECESNPCLNYGDCVNGPRSYTCVCQPGFAGPNCAEKVYDCRTHACQNGGECVPEGEHNYTCRCKLGFSEEYCQFRAVDGSWHSWSEWSACSQSCAGGESVRRRRCNIPEQNFGGRSCTGASEERKVCNSHECPVCKRLRRPYGGTMRCKRGVDMVYCTVDCFSGFSPSSRISEYSCGKNTSYLWPHESPDNPRCVLPACTKIAQPVETNYQFRSSLPLECTTETTETELKRQIGERAAEMTSSLECLYTGECHLKEPKISGCLSRQKRAVDESARVSGQRFVDFKVAIAYPYQKKADPDKSTDPLPDMVEFGKKLMTEAATGNMYLVIDGAHVTVVANQSSMLNILVCSNGSVPAPVGDYCVECSPGSFHSVDSDTCVLCEEGSYQPQSASMLCLPCPAEQTTYGRGAVNLIECYENGTVPPTIPEDIIATQGVATGVIVAVVVVGCIGVLVIICIIIVIQRKRSYAKYHVVTKPGETAAGAQMSNTAEPTEMERLEPTNQITTENEMHNAR